MSQRTHTKIADLVYKFPCAHCGNIAYDALPYIIGGERKPEYLTKEYDLMTVKGIEQKVADLRNPETWITFAALCDMCWIKTKYYCGDEGHFAVAEKPQPRKRSARRQKQPA
jgi:hypothetical protein